MAIVVEDSGPGTVGPSFDAAVHLHQHSGECCEKVRELLALLHAQHGALVASEQAREFCCKETLVRFLIAVRNVAEIAVADVSVWLKWDGGVCVIKETCMCVCIFGFVCFVTYVCGVRVRVRER